ncbi:hypothetical protein NC652_017762 [Populus alba x Populus x berolinensis]|nr:hypothetical protein NC652_017762 [Populus alba x Populus x berolinensis]
MGLKTILLMISIEDMVPWMELCTVNQSKKPDQELSISRPGQDIKTSFGFSQSLQNESPFEFIRHLQGSKKGDKVEGADQLKKFLHHFGYLNHGGLNNDEIDDDYFDETIERALKTYQINFNLKPTGVLDAETVSLMMKPRCRVPEVVDGKTRMKSAGSYIIDYAFFPGSPKWLKTTKVLNWGYRPGTRRDVLNPLGKIVLNDGSES